ncbi:uncharacterized protein LOC111714557 [Eurytemora carolleeae]|uniref:uncharacterized protein LOC111714557 n=1 Tax=Eurytemora carolleeae TaxID=1294199 RepID=UPI000C78A1CA|nr:uncharacterized protein LOC111714557 [Eurytemora carolleeae]|eukprot:XP_023345459.1 uncharacterized protein LOC111714557 [Eurytemora affinis]
MLNVVITLGLIVGSNALQWEANSPGEILPNALGLNANTNTLKYFCKFPDGVIGVVSNNKDICQGVKDGEYVSTGDFSVLTSTSNEEVDWKYCSEAPTTAISCDLQVTSEGDCHFGQSVYSDGICHESIGPIQDGVVNMVVKKRPSRCPFKLYLVSGKAQDGTCT